MMNRTILKMLILLGSLVAGPIYALGLGKITLHSNLNEPLSASIQLVSVGDVSPNEVLVNLASQEDFDKAMVERSYQLNSLAFQLDLSDRRNPVLIVTTSNPIREPSLDFIVELRSPSGRVLREYTLLLDIAQAGAARQPTRRSTVVVKRAHPVVATPKADPVASTAPPATPSVSAPAVSPVPAAPVPAVPSEQEVAAEAAAKAALAAQLASAQEQANHAITENEALKKQSADLSKQLADASAQLEALNAQLQTAQAALAAANAAKQQVDVPSATPAAPVSAAPAPASEEATAVTPPPPSAPVQAAPVVETAPVQAVPEQPVVATQPPVQQVSNELESESEGSWKSVFTALAVVLVIAIGLWGVRKRQSATEPKVVPPIDVEVAPHTDSEVDVALAQYGAEHPIAAQQEEAAPPVEEKPLTTDEALDRLLVDMDLGQLDVPPDTQASTVDEAVSMDQLLPPDELISVEELENWSTETLSTEAAPIDKDFVFEPELFAEPEVSAVEMETPAPVVTAQAEPIVDEAFHDATDRDFVVTKLELARQYLEMSDAESARDLLQEVLEEGDEELKQAATDLLKKIS
ncbi:MAG: FimV/HubP family polar landmark protein [Pseudomonadales bacterium]|nr:FimV/HubP family polar landmark protein [Pseudomonadales bacterium]